jgi:phosphate transport system protein
MTFANSEWKPMQPHTVTAYDADLKALDGLVGEMASRSEISLADAAKALFAGDVSLAQQVISADATIDLLQHSIEEKAISTIAKRQPVAIDLRHIVSTIRIASDLERIGDLAKNVAKRVIAMGEQPASIKVASSLAPLAARVRDQLENVSAAYRQRDDGAALEVWRADGAIDTLHTSLFRELLTYMMEDPRSIGFCAHLLFCAKNLERIGDHATNIAETTHYMITGDMLATERPKADGSSGVDPNWGPNKT